MYLLLCFLIASITITNIIIIIIIIITNTAPIAPDIIGTALEPVAVPVLGGIIFDGVTIDVLVGPIVLIVEVPVVTMCPVVVDGIATVLVYDDESVLEADTVTIYHSNVKLLIIALT